MLARQPYYASSVPVRYIGRQLRVLLHANDLVVYDGRTVITRHERLGGRHGSRLVLDHYLEALLRKPRAFPGSTALEQARSAGRFTPVHNKWWAAAKAAHGDAAGTRACSVRSSVNDVGAAAGCRRIDLTSRSCCRSGTSSAQPSARCFPRDGAGAGCLTPCVSGAAARTGAGLPMRRLPSAGWAHDRDPHTPSPPP
ncbi:Mu transposase domain-containing protein [Streptomyces sp. NPDC001492]